jgi:hypothetical protein
MRRGLIALTAVLVATSPGRAVAGASLQSLNSSFGFNTITFDPNTGLQWLDLTESTGYSKSQMQSEIQPGGAFEGHHLATDDEIRQLFLNAGIYVGPGSNEFIAVNYAPIVQLASFIGVLGTGGNCGGGCTFSYTQGFTAEPPPFAGTVAATDLAWFDNDPPQSPSYPTASIGRVGFGGGRGNNASADVGSWLIVPEPDAVASSAAALLVIASRRRARPSCGEVATR